MQHQPPHSSMIPGAFLQNPPSQVQNVKNEPNAFNHVPINPSYRMNIVGPRGQSALLTPMFNPSIPLQMPAAASVGGVTLTAPPSSLTQPTYSSSAKPLVALLDGRDCSHEMPLLKHCAIFAFCDAQLASEIHSKVLNEAHTALIWNTMMLGREELLKFKMLKHLVRIGSCADNVDIRAAGELGIAVSNVPHCSVNEMADTTLSLILNVYRKTIWMANKCMIEGKHPISSEQSNLALRGIPRISGKRLGIVGFGRVGTCVFQRAKAFGFDVGFYDPFVGEGTEDVFGLHRYASLNDLLRECDCVTLHCPLTERTVNMLDQQAFTTMKPGSILVNTASMRLVEETALIESLMGNRLRGAALDVFEPGTFTAPSQILRDCPNLLLTSRISWYSDEACVETRVCAAEEVIRGLNGKIPNSLKYCINRQYLRKNSLPNMDQTCMFNLSHFGNIPTQPATTTLKPIFNLRTMPPNYFPQNVLHRGPAPASVGLQRSTGFVTANLLNCTSPGQPDHSLHNCSSRDKMPAKLVHSQRSSRRNSSSVADDETEENGRNKPSESSIHSHQDDVNSSTTPGGSNLTEIS